MVDAAISFSNTPKLRCRADPVRDVPPPPSCMSGCSALAGMCVFFQGLVWFVCEGSQDQTANQMGNPRKAFEGVEGCGEC